MGTLFIGKRFAVVVSQQNKWKPHIKHVALMELILPRKEIKRLNIDQRLKCIRQIVLLEPFISTKGKYIKIKGIVEGELLKGAFTKGDLVLIRTIRRYT